MDDDKDGVIQVDHVMKVIELLGTTHAKLPAKQIKQLVDMLAKEDMLASSCRHSKVPTIDLVDFAVDALVGAASLLREAGAGTPLLGARTFADVFASVEDQEAVKLDLCVTALFLIPLLFIPNMISQSLDQVSSMHNNQ